MLIKESYQCTTVLSSQLSLLVVVKYCHILLQVEVVDSLVEDPDQMDHEDQDDHQSEHSDAQDQPPPEQEEVVAESDMDLDLIGESDSDSESSHSNPDNVSVQRSAVTAATAGSDAGVGSLAYFSEDDEEVVVS